MSHNDRIIELAKTVFDADHLNRVARVFGQAPESVDKQLRLSNTYTFRDVALMRLVLLAKENGFLDQALSAIDEEKDVMFARLQTIHPTVGREEEIARRIEAGETVAAVARSIGCTGSAVQGAVARLRRQSARKPVRTE